MSDSSIAANYTRSYWEALTPIAKSLEELLKGYLQDSVHVDRISARAKSPDRFITKAEKTDSAGVPKYSSPLTQIQDQIAARVVVFYLSDVEPMVQVLLRYFRSIESKKLVPDDVDRFGYVGHHLILALPTEAIPERIAIEDGPEFFEMQVKTLWQHAWSEANHDVGYKPGRRLSDDQRRSLAFTAAQAWGADRMFEELVSEAESSQ